MVELFKHSGRIYAYSDKRGREIASRQVTHVEHVRAWSGSHKVVLSNKEYVVCDRQDPGTYRIGLRVYCEQDFTEEEAKVVLAWAKISQ